MHDNLIILAGGVSSRMKNSEAGDNLSSELIEQSNTKSKGLISIDEDGRPLLDYLLFNAKKAGYKNIFFVLSESGSEHFKKLYGRNLQNNPFHGLSISYAVQKIPSSRVKPLGTADAVFQTLEQFPRLQSEEFSVCNSDNLYSLKAFQNLRKNNDKNALLGYDRDSLNYSTDRISSFALLKIDKDGFLKDIIEKPELSRVSEYKDGSGKLRVSMNIFKFNGNELYQYFKDCPIHPIRNEKEIPTVLSNYIHQKNGKIRVLPFADHVPDLTSKEDILVMKQFINNHYGQLDWKL